MTEVKSTYRNARAGTNGVFWANHNTQTEHRKTQKNVDTERIDSNIYYKFGVDGRVLRVRGSYDAVAHELKLYRHFYGKGIEEQNQRHIESRHPERCRTIEQIYQNKKTAPVETILQVGNSHCGLSKEEQAQILWKAATKLVNELKKKYGKNIVPLDISLHMDEKVPHIHLRYNYAHIDRYGYLSINQNAALEEMGFKRPDETKPRSRYNNALMSFTDTVRERFYQLCEEQGIKINREVESPSQRHQSRQESRCIALENYIKELENQAIEMLERSMLNKFMRVGRYFSQDGEKCYIMDAYKRFREYEINQMKQMNPEHIEIYEQLANKTDEDIKNEFEADNGDQNEFDSIEPV